MIKFDLNPTIFPSYLQEDFSKISDLVIAAAGKTQYSQKLNSYDLLTEIDVRVEDIISDRLMAITPNIDVVGEEKGGDRSKKIYWLVDPIDGTIHFTRGNPFYCTMIALIEDKKPIFSMVYNISTGDLYSASRGQGAYRNNQRMFIESREAREAIVQTEIDLRVKGNIELYRELSTNFRLMSLFAPGFELSLIAAGRAEARICISPFGKDYDFAPGALLVEEARGVVKDTERQEYTTESKDIIFASSDEIFESLLSYVDRCRSLN